MKHLALTTTILTLHLITSPLIAQTPEVAPDKNQSKTQDTVLFKKTDRGLVNLDFVNAEIADIAKSISELTKRNFVFDENVRGKITLVSPQPVTVDEAYRAFISALEVKNFTVVKTGRLYKIVPIRDMKSQPISTEGEGTTGGSDEFVTRLIAIKHTSANEIAKSLRGLVSKNGDLIAYPPTNTLILTDSVANIKRLLRIVNNLDQKGFQETVQIIPLKFAPASDTAEKVKKIFDIGSSAQKIPNPNTPPDSISDAGQFISNIIPDERTNSLIIVANQEGLRRVKEVIDQIDQTMKDQTGKGYVHVHYLQYADAVELAATLSGASSSKSNNNQNRRGSTSNMFTQQNNQANQPPFRPMPDQQNTGASISENIKIIADAPTNSLIISASPAEYESLIPVINRLDIRRPQAFVESMIMEVDIDKAAEFGAAANLGGSVKSGKLFGATNFGSTSSIFVPSDPTGLQGLTTVLQGPTFDIPLAGGESLTIPTYGGLFRAMQSNGTINVLSTPNILTQDNVEAQIVVGRVVPFITAQGRDVNNQPINQIQREDVAITLKITPQINSSDELTLNIFQESQDLVPGADLATFGPTTSRRSAQTTVLVKDGQTITVGGLINDTVQTSINKVPLLGDIPILGWLFKSKSKIKRKTSLVIFITPHIIRYPQDMEKITLRKNEERRKFLQSNNIKDIHSNQDLEGKIKITKASQPVEPTQVIEPVAPVLNNTATPQSDVTDKSKQDGKEPQIIEILPPLETQKQETPITENQPDAQPQDNTKQETINPQAQTP